MTYGRWDGVDCTVRLELWGHTHVANVPACTDTATLLSSTYRFCLDMYILGNNKRAALVMCILKGECLNAESFVAV
jgi:hypothetical protein